MRRRQPNIQDVRSAIVQGALSQLGGEIIENAPVGKLLDKFNFVGALSSNKDEGGNLFRKLAKDGTNGPSSAGVGGGLPFTNQSASSRMVGQELPMSCGAACARQILRDAGIDVTEAVVRDAALFDSNFGIDAGNLAEALNQIYPGASFRGGGVPPEAFDALNNTGPWIARVKPSTGAHFVIVDGVKGDLVRIRDPWGNAAPGVGEGLEGTLPVQKFQEYWLRGINQAVFRVN